MKYKIKVNDNTVVLKGKLENPYPEGWYTTKNNVEIEIEDKFVTVRKNFDGWTGVLDLVDSLVDSSELNELSYKEFKIWKETYEENKGNIAYFLRHDCFSPIDLGKVSFEEFIEKDLPDGWKTRLILRTIEEVLHEYVELM